MFWNTKKVVVREPVLIEELLSRGVSEVVTKDELRQLLSSGRSLRVKLGIDPTSPHIHLGRAVPLLKLRDFQKLGHTVVFIVGDFTGIIGDTSDKESERPMLSEKQVLENLQSYFLEAGLILDMKRVETHYNSEWLSKLTYKEIGEHAEAFSLSDFIARENIARRLSAGSRVSLREVLYPLMQGYDSVAVKADIELGGTDQRFNLLSGRRLQEKSGQKPQCIMTVPLIRGTDGRKMSSSWVNTISIASSPSEMFGKVMSINDDAMREYFITLTRLPEEEINEIIGAVQNGKGNPKSTKLRLAREIVKIFHGEKVSDIALQNFEKVFSEGGIPAEVSEIKSVAGNLFRELAVKSGIVSSKTEWRRLVLSGAVSYADTDVKISDSEAFVSKDVILKIGKRRFLKILV